MSRSVFPMAMKVRYEVINRELIAVKRDGVRRCCVPDASGNIIALLDEAQNQTDTFLYGPFGEIADRSGSAPSPPPASRQMSTPFGHPAIRDRFRPDTACTPAHDPLAVERWLLLAEATGERYAKGKSASESQIEECGMACLESLAEYLRVGEISGWQDIEDAWVIDRAEHDARNYLRSERARLRREVPWGQVSAGARIRGEALHPTLAASIEDAVIAEELAPRMQRVAEGLPAEQACLWMRRFLDHKRIKQLSAELGITQNAVKKRLGRVILAFRNALKRQGLDEAEARDYFVPSAGFQALLGTVSECWDEDDDS